MAAKKKGGRKSAQDQVFDEREEAINRVQVGMPGPSSETEPETSIDDDGPLANEETEPEAADAAPMAELPKAGKRYLRHELTQDDIDDLREEREDGDAEIEAHLVKLRSLEADAKSLKKVIEGLEEEGRTISRTIREGWDYRDVECFETEAPKVGGDADVAGIGTYRKDTGEQIEWREATGAERQGRLF